MGEGKWRTPGQIEEDRQIRELVRCLVKLFNDGRLTVRDARPAERVHDDHEGLFVQHAMERLRVLRDEGGPGPDPTGGALRPELARGACRDAAPERGRGKVLELRGARERKSVGAMAG